MKLGQDIKFTLRLGKSVAKYLIGGYPLVKSYDITYKCNLNCKHCYFYKNHKKIDIDPISDDEWKAIFQKEKNAGVFEVYITGGEPMLRPRVIEHATEIFGVGRVTIVTNGTIKIPTHWKNNICVSIDGDENTQTEIRGGILGNIINNIKNNKRVIISPTISNLNYKKIRDLYNIAKMANVKGISFSFYTGKTKEDAITGEILNEAIDSIREIKKLDPDFVIVTEKMLKVLKNKSHVKRCVLRKGMVVSHLPDMEIKKPCIFGENIDCSNCGWHVPILAASLKCFDFETIRLMRKVFA